MLLDLHICQVGLEIVNVVRGVGLVGESGKSTPVEPGCQLTVICAKAVYSKVKLF